MAIGVGVAKQLIYKAESTWGTAPGTGSAQVLRRVTSNLALRKDIYSSNEKVTHYQVLDSRHGMRSVAGSINGELSPATYKDFFAAAVRKTFSATSSISSLSITIAASGSDYTVARGTGSWITDGIKAGDVVRLTAGSFTAGNLNNNLLVLSETASTLTVRPVNRSTLTAEGPIGSATLAVPGKRTFAPTTGHTDTSFAIEHYHSDLTLSELFLGCKLNSLAVGLPPSGMATVGMDFVGKDVTTAGSAYYSGPTAATEYGVATAVNGILAVQGSVVALLTGLNFTISGGMVGAGPIVGSNTYADIGEGRVQVSGSFTALFQDAVLRDYFINETEVSLFVVAPCSPANAADFVSFALPRVKVNSADRDDPDQAITQTMNFQALLNGAGGTGTSSEETTIVIQDSQA